MGKLLYNIHVIILCYVFPTFSSHTIITDLSLRSGPRGLLFIVTTNKPIDDSFQNLLRIEDSLINIKIFNVMNGLKEESFSHFPPSIPIEKIFINETKLFSHIQLSVRKGPITKIKTKYKKNTIQYLLSTTPFSRYQWFVHGSEKNETNNQKHLVTTPSKRNLQTSEYVMKNIEILHRGTVEKLTIDIDSSVLIKTQNRKDVLIALFENAINGFTHSVLSLPKHSLFNQLFIKERTYGDRSVVGLIFNKSLQKIIPLFMQVEPGKFTIYAVHDLPDSHQPLALWSSTNAHTNTIVQNVKKDGDPPPKNLERRSTKRILVIHDKVPFCSEPNSHNSNTVIANLPLGCKGLLLNSHKSWHYITIDSRSDTGWIQSVHIRDSASVSKKQWRTLTSNYKKTVEKKANLSLPPRKVMKSDAFVQSVESITQIPKILAKKEDALIKMVGYKAYGRDPFLPLDNPDFIESDLPNIEQCRLVGILFDNDLKIALLENPITGEAYALQEKSSILNGRLLKIKRNTVIFLLNGVGYSQRYVLNLQSNKD